MKLDMFEESTNDTTQGLALCCIGLAHDEDGFGNNDLLHFSQKSLSLIADMTVARRSFCQWQ